MYLEADRHGRCGDLTERHGCYIFYTILEPENTMPPLTALQQRTRAVPARSERNRVKQIMATERSEALEAEDIRAFYAAQEASLPAYRAYGETRKARRAAAQ
ncbi:MAG TPA: hypothetical protein VF584_20390 [Longimicrobium sp.]